MNEMLPESSKVKSLGKALRVLECFSVKTPELGVTEIADRLGINKSNAYNIIKTFSDLGYLEKRPSGKYALGIKMLEYSFIVNENLGYPRAIYDILSDVSQQTNEIVYFAIPHADKALYLYVVHPLSLMQSYPYREILGETAPLYCTGIGKAMLAFMPENEWYRRIPQEREQYTPLTVTDLDGIINSLKQTRLRGYSIDDGEREENIRCVGMPVFNFSGKVLGAISISGSMKTITYDKVAKYAEILRAATFRMKQRLY